MDQLVWLPDAVDGYVLGKINDISSDSVTATTVTPPNKTIQAPYKSVFPSERDNSKDVNDNCALMFLNEATLLHNLRIRYQKDKIYTYVANIAIAINPYAEIKDLYSSSTIKKYQGKSLGTLEPHVFAIADKAVRDMKAFRLSQSVIVSGESGAGKTESTKYVLRYLCESWGSQLGQIEQLILDANPLLEAFGNAKTVRNRNSSRFGKFIEIHFGSKFTVVGGFISHYLLEQSRICGQSRDERNYHIFYQLIAGLDKELFTKLGLKSPDHFHYLNRGCTQFLGSKKSDSLIAHERKSQLHLKSGVLEDAIVDDLADFKAMNSALDHFGMSPVDRQTVYQIVAAVLHIGNISFEECPDDSKGGCRISDGNSRTSLETASSLLGISSGELEQCLVSRIMQTKAGGHKGTVYLVPLKVYEAQYARDALAKAVYSRLFDHLVTKVVNKAIPFAQSLFYIGVLDIAGFEYFQVNSFEQFCINYCNEKLQQFFNERILKEEQNIYQSEGLGLKAIDFVDNQDCIDLLEKKSIGIFDLLDEESKLPKPSAAHFTESVHTHHTGQHFRIELPRKSKLKHHRELRDEEGFVIRHFAGAVCYVTGEFITKNSDALHASLELLMAESKNNLIRELFTSKDCSKDKYCVYSNGHSSANIKTGKLSFTSVGSRFRSQLNELMLKLQSTGTHFIRCIKPNVTLVPKKFEGNHILSQLRCSGMNSVLELMQQGYPSRAPFSDLYNMYSSYLPPDLAKLDPRTFCRLLFKALGLNEADFKFGSTRVFFRPGKFAEFDQIMKSDPEHLAHLVSKVKQWLVISRWKRAQWTALSVVKLAAKIELRKQFIIRLQKYSRAFICTKKYRHRYLALVELRKLEKKLSEVKRLIEQLTSKSLKDQELTQAGQLEKLIKVNMSQIRSNPKITPEEVSSCVQSVVDQINSQISSLTGRIKEEKRLKQLEEEMKLQAEKKAHEDKKKLEEEQLKQRKLDLERKFQLENQNSNNQNNQKSNSICPSGKSKAVTEPTRDSLKEQQEALDHELAVKLAQESGTHVEQVSPVLLHRGFSRAAQAPPVASKYEHLTKWKYSALRDTINTSTDIELLEACKEEFHRRLRVYHEWKAKNARAQEQESELRVPLSILQNASNGSSNGPTGNYTSRSKNGEDRFFRIPFVRPASLGGQKGWWWAHFHGQWISRQMELHPEKPPILLVAGKDDMQMCELSLEETRLTTKRGAEILPEEFEKEWTKNGGHPLNGKH